MATTHHSQPVLIPTEFALDPRVTSRAARVYLYLASLPEGDRQSVSEIARTLGMGRGTVTRALDDLEETGYVTRGRGGEARG